MRVAAVGPRARHVGRCPGSRDGGGSRDRSS
jgi:hypothetical protein